MARVQNKDRKFGSALSYIHVRHRGRDLLMTQHEWNEARKRAEVNPEDIPRPWWQFWRAK